MLTNHSIYPSIFLSRAEFVNIYNGVVATFSRETAEKLPSPEVLLSIKYLEKQYIELIDLIMVEVDVSDIDIYVKSILDRMVVVSCILASYENESLHLNMSSIWPLVKSSLIHLSEADVTSSIGSQGFLSIPLFENNDDELDILKLHIWDTSLDEFIDREKVERFSIHSHKFHAKSWIVCGEIINTRYKVEELSVNPNGNYFEITWMSKDNDFNTRTSIAKNTDTSVFYSASKIEKYRSGTTYEIPVGEFHKSEVSKDELISSTLFLFSTRKGKRPKSFVIGPSHIAVSEVNRKIRIDPGDFLTKIDNNILRS